MNLSSFRHSAYYSTGSIVLWSIRVIHVPPWLHPQENGSPNQPQDTFLGQKHVTSISDWAVGIAFVSRSYHQTILNLRSTIFKQLIAERKSN